MNSIASWQETLIASWGQVWSAFLGIIPPVLGSVIVFSVGLVLAFWAKRLLVEVSKLIKLEKLSKSLGIDDYLSKAGTKLDLTQIVGGIVEWLIILVFFLAAVDILGLNAVARVLTGFLTYIPNIFAAALIFAAGYFIAGVVGGLVRGALASVGHEIAKPVGKLSRWVIIVITFFAAVGELQIAQALITTFFQGLTYTLVLVVGLSIGLGAKDLVSKILNEWYDKFKK